MARIRTIKPEFWTDEKMAKLDPLTRLVFLGLICMADDYGRLVDNVKSIDGMLFPVTSESCKSSLNSLATLQRITRYTSEAGQKLIQINRWAAHQKVNHPGKEIYPAPSQEDFKRVSSESQESDKRVSGLISVPVPRTSTNDLSTDSGESGAKSKPKYPAFPVSDSNRLHQTCIQAGHAVEMSVLRKAIAPLYPASGPVYPLADLERGLTAFLEAREAQPPDKARFWTLIQFAQDAARWVRLGAMPLADANGVTERGRVAMGTH